jgi:cell division septation protein DedD
MKKIFILNLLLLCSIYAQDLHEFSLHIGGGVSTLRYAPTFGEQSHGLDKQFGFNYAFFVSPRFGFGTGLELAFYNAEFKLKDLKMAYEAKDLYGKAENFEFRSNLSNYTEEQNAVMLQIPVMLQFQTGIGYYMMAGVKIAVPLSGSSSGKGDLMNSGYYEEENCQYYISDCKGEAQSGDNRWGFKGFGAFKRKTENQENFKSSLLASMEMGMKWRFEDGLSLYTGVYFDYGLGNILEKKKAEELPRMVEYNSDNPPNFAMNGMFNSQWEQNKAPQTFVTRVMPMAIGVKIKLALGQDVDHFVKKDKEERIASAEIKRLEVEKQLLELNLARSAASEKMLIERETERLAAAEKLLLEARIAYEKAQNEQEAARAVSAEVARLAAEKAQLEQEVAHLASGKPDVEIEAETKVLTKVETPQPLPIQKAEQDTTHSGGEWIVQIAVVLQESRAESMVNSLKQKGFNAYYKKVSNPGKLTGTYYRVRVGYFSGMRQAEDFAKANLQSYNNWWIDKTENDTK